MDFFNTNAQAESWQLLYLALVSLVVPLLCVPIAVENRRRGMRSSPLVTLLALPGLLMWFTPYGWAFLFTLFSLFLGIEGVPVGAYILIAVWWFASFVLAVHGTFGARSFRVT